MSTTVTTTYGSLRGSGENGLLIFRGIPFAQPPVGDFRWRAPQPPATWEGERDATEFGPSAPQRQLAGGIGDLIGIPSERMDEDCLYLNVWTPGLDGSRPVMVWIHGGGNTVGSGSQPRINGEHLARTGDVVVVTLNYRLGALGFLHAPELGASGNEALLDQAAGLRWVRQEIAAFGGDPANVTVFGQSAGGFDIAQLMAMPAAAGCFDKAIPMSGSISPQVPADQAHETAARFAERFGGWDRLRDVPADDIIAYQQELTGARFGPVLDGDVIREDAAAGIGRGDHTRGMPLMIGCTRDEYALFTVMNESLATLDDEGLERLASRTFGDRTAQAIATYRRARASRGQGTKPIDIWNAIMTDQMFRIPAIRTAELHSAHTPDTWMYLFDYESPALDGRAGSCHSLDIAFVWGTYEAPSVREFGGSGPHVAALSKKTMAAYLAFARTGNPNTTALPDWPRYDTAHRATMRLGLTPHIEDAPLDEERRLWAEMPVS